MMNPNQKRAGREASSQTVVTSPSRRRLLRVPGIRGILSIAGALGAGVAIAVLAAGGSYAYLNFTVPTTSGGTLNAGTAGVTLARGTDPATTALTIPASVYQRMLPGDIVNQSLTIANTGTVDLAMVVTATSDGAWETRAQPGACPAGVLPTTAFTTTPVSYGTLPAGTSAAFCLQVVLPAGAPAATENTSISYTVTFDGTQVAS